MKVVMNHMMEEGSGRTRQKHVRRTYGFLIALLLIVLWILVIWSMSTQSSQQQDIQPWLHKWSQNCKSVLRYQMCNSPTGSMSIR